MEGAASGRDGLGAELRVRAAVARGAPPPGAGRALLRDSWLLRAEEAPTEAGWAASGALDACWVVRERGGMPGGFGAEETGEGGEELAGALGALLGQLSLDVSGLERAVHRLDAGRGGEGGPRQQVQTAVRPLVLARGRICVDF
jgi:hypothetical protein